MIETRLLQGEGGPTFLNLSLMDCQERPATNPLSSISWGEGGEGGVVG